MNELSNQWEVSVTNATVTQDYFYNIWFSWVKQDKLVNPAALWHVPKLDNKYQSTKKMKSMSLDEERRCSTVKLWIIANGQMFPPCCILTSKYFWKLSPQKCYSIFSRTYINACAHARAHTHRWLENDSY